MNETPIIEILSDRNFQQHTRQRAKSFLTVRRSHVYAGITISLV
jgi:hypothetical protein